MGSNGRDASKARRSQQEIQEELSFLKQKANSLAFRGEYAECIKLIEDNAAALYIGERWPQNFLSVLLLHKKCYPSLDRDEPYEEYAAKMLAKAGVPALFAELARNGGRDAEWSAEYLRDRALELRSKKDYGRALDFAALYQKTEPHNTNAFLVQGWIFEDMGKAAEAIAMYEQALEFNPGNLQASQSIARAYAAADPKKAMEYVLKAIQEHPDDAGFQAAKAQILTRTGNREAAIEAWDKAAELDPYQYSYPYEKAELLLADGKDMAAAAHYRKALALNERHIPSLRRLAFLFADQTPEAALECARAVVTADGSDMEAGLLYGNLLRRCGDREGADRQYRALLELNAEDHRVWAGLARIYRRTEPAKALEYFDRAIALKGDLAEYHMGRAMALEAGSRMEEAAAAYKTAAELNKASAVPLGALGRLTAEQNPAESLSYFDRAVKLDAKNAAYHDGRAKALLKIGGRARHALDALETACKLDSGNAALHLHMGQLLEQMGNRASSVRHYEEAANLEPTLHEAEAGVARQLADTLPHRALTRIDKAISGDMTNAGYYYWKARILARLASDDYAVAQLGNMETAGGELQEELMQLSSGGALRLALFYINRSVELAPQQNAALCFRANLLAEIGEETQARGQFEALLKHSPDNHEALHGLALLLLKRGEDKRALELLEQAIRLAPREARYPAAKARLLAKDPERYGEAAACYKAAIPLDTWAWEPVLELAELQDENGDEFEAMANYRRCLLIYRDCLPATARMGRLLSAYNPMAALNYIRHAVRLDGEDWTHHAWMGCILHKLNRPGEAEEAVALAVRLAGQNAEVYYKLADILFPELPEQAAHYIGLAVRDTPGSSDYHLLLGDVLRALGRPEEALAAYRRAAELDGRNHLAKERCARMLYERGETESLALIGEAVKAAPKEAEYLALKAEILDTLQGDTALAIAALDAALKLAPARVDLRERLVALLVKKRSLLRIPLEKARLEKVRRRYAGEYAAAAQAEEIAFEDEAQAANSE